VSLFVSHGVRRALFAPEQDWDTGTRVVAIWLGLNLRPDYVLDRDSVRTRYLMELFDLSDREVRDRVSAMVKSGWIQNVRRRRVDAKRVWLKKASELKIRRYVNEGLVQDQFLRHYFAQLPTTRQLVLLYIAAHINKDGIAHPRPQTIAAGTGLHVDTVQRSIEQLADWEILEVVRQEGRDYPAYRVRTDDEVAEANDAAAYMAAVRFFAAGGQELRGRPNVLPETIRAHRVMKHNGVTADEYAGLGQKFWSLRAASLPGNVMLLDTLVAELIATKGA
jgi:hypothetical protein